MRDCARGIGSALVVIIRSARESDAPVVARLAGELGYPATPDEAAQRLRSALARPDEASLVIESDATVIGWIHVLGVHRIESGSFAEITGLVIAEARRGAGAGRALVAEAERWAAAREYRTLRVRSNVIREDTHRFYEGLGFARTKSQAVFAKQLAVSKGEPAGSFGCAAIGRVECPVVEPVDSGWGDVVSRIVLFPAYRPGIEGLEGYSHVIVLTYLHRAGFDPRHDLTRHPRGSDSFPEVGIFAQRAKDRPNPIGVTAVRIIEVGHDSVRVRGLDAIDGTPVLDIKPYVPQFDRVESPTVPPWNDELMRGYF